MKLFIFPKVLFVLMGLTFARDEILWLLRHHDNLPLTKVKVRSQVKKSESRDINRSPNGLD